MDGVDISESGDALIAPLGERIFIFLLRINGITRLNSHLGQLVSLLFKILPGE